jgi:hypothetical protein
MLYLSTGHESKYNACQAQFGNRYRILPLTESLVQVCSADGLSDLILSTDSLRHYAQSVTECAADETSSGNWVSIPQLPVPPLVDRLVKSA